MDNLVCCVIDRLKYVQSALTELSFYIDTPILILRRDVNEADFREEFYLARDGEILKMRKSLKESSAKPDVWNISLQEGVSQLKAVIGEDELLTTVACMYSGQYPHIPLSFSS